MRQALVRWHRWRVFAPVCLVALTVAAATALAGPINDSAVCGSYTYKQAFAAWGDQRSYTLAPGGAAENQSGWTLSGGVKMVSGNESSYANSVNDRSSLFLPAGSSATSQSMCIMKRFPTFRLFALNTGATSTTVRVEVLYETVTGATRAKMVGMITAGSAWTPTSSFPVLFDTDAVVRGDGTRSEERRVGKECRL